MHAAADWVIRPARREDTGPILTLIAESFAGRNVTSTPEYWRWKHELNPFGPSPILVAESGGRLVGLRAFMRWAWRSGERTIRAVRAVDTATHPAFQRRGVFSKLTLALTGQLAAEGVGFVFNTPNAKSGPGYLKMGWRVATRLPIWVKPLRASILAARGLGIRRTEPPDTASLPPARAVLEQAGVEEIIARAERGDDRYHTHRTRPYLTWRFGTVPGLSYRASLARGGSDGALIVARGRNRFGLRELAVCEIIATQGSGGVRHGCQALQAMLAQTNADYVIASAAPDTTEASVLLRSGFLRVPRAGPRVTVFRLALPDDAPALERWAHWRCSIGDLELF
jgi:GNAT superfamily N-acetyltransferase